MEREWKGEQPAAEEVDEATDESQRITIPSGLPFLMVADRMYRCLAGSYRIVAEEASESQIKGLEETLLAR